MARLGDRAGPRLLIYVQHVPVGQQTNWRRMEAPVAPQVHNSLPTACGRPDKRYSPEVDPTSRNCPSQRVAQSHQDSGTNTLLQFRLIRSAVRTFACRQAGTQTAL